MNTKALGFDSKLVHAGTLDDAYGSAVTPIYQTSTFGFESAEDGADRFAGRSDGFIYTRLGNPTVRALEGCVAELEEGAGPSRRARAWRGVHCLSFAPRKRRPRREHRLGVRPSRTLLEKHLSRFGVTASFVDTSDLSLVRAALRPETRMIYVETPSNPLMQITDLRAVGEIARERGIRFVVDSTFASPLLQKPIALGADVVLHSVTKFLNGHATWSGAC